MCRSLIGPRESLAPIPVKYLGPAVDDVHFYQIWMTDTGKVIQTRDVTFLKNDSTQPSSHFQLNEGQKLITKARIESDTNSDSEDKNLEIASDRSNFDASCPSSEDDPP